MSHASAAPPPSFFLFSLFLAFKFLPKDMLNLVLTVYFVALVSGGASPSPPAAVVHASSQGLVAIATTLAPFAARLLPRGLARKTVRAGAAACRAAPHPSRRRPLPAVAGLAEGAQLSV